jgi:hypothetical protein
MHLNKKVLASVEVETETREAEEMAFPGNKADFYDRVSSKIFEGVPRETFYTKCRVLIWTGYLTGLFPVQNVTSSKSSASLVTKKISLAYAYR